MKYDVKKAEEGERIALTASLSRAEARQLMTILDKGAKDIPAGHSGTAMWRRVAQALRDELMPPAPQPEPKPLPKLKRRWGIERPPSDHPNELDMDHVLNGRPPYPVLSHRDLKTVYPDLEAKGLAAYEIAGRLHISARTVVRYRTRMRKGLRP